MMERAYSDGGRKRHEMYQSEEVVAGEQPVMRRAKKVRWRFKPRVLGILVTCGLVLFISGRLVVIPLLEGVYQYCAKTKELADLQLHSKSLDKQLIALEKARKYMQTDAYIEEKGHQIGMIKENESQMVVVNSKALKFKEEQHKKAKQEVYRD